MRSVADFEEGCLTFALKYAARTGSWNAVVQSNKQHRSQRASDKSGASAVHVWLAPNHSKRRFANSFSEQLDFDRGCESVSVLRSVNRAYFLELPIQGAE
jgi:hypothetical protein